METFGYGDEVEKTLLNGVMAIKGIQHSITEKKSHPSIYSITYEVEGIVQGVGFRPAVYRLAAKAKLGGWIKNTSGNVTLCLIGEIPHIAEFIINLHANLPPQAKLTSINPVEKKKIGKNLIIPEFVIIESTSGKSKKVVIPADIAMCDDCMKEILDQKNRRYGYPFTTCTDCGPRYTVVNDMPYDREQTTLKNFPLCDECSSEYNDPQNRRFRAESTACPHCGPQVFLTDSKGKVKKCKNPIKSAKNYLAKGKIVAIRGLGGFLLAADAFNRKTLVELRKRKTRPDKPFALMFRDIDTVLKYCEFNMNLTKQLMSPESPIIIAEIKNNCNLPVDLISPDTKTLGVMIPYTPLHKLLFEQLAGETNSPSVALVMTSGNTGGEPICISNQDAFERLANIADFILCHNREINLRNDDSISTIQLKAPQLWRRARGYAPASLFISLYFDKNILAMGADLKNAIAIAFDHEVVFSPHIGDLETPEAVNSLKQIAETLPKFLEKGPELIAVDLHPDFHSVRIGYDISKQLGVELVKVQHHQAHAVSCMVENNLDKALALVFDGTGLGLDGNIWGAELFYINSLNDKIERLATYSPVQLPGGEAAIRQPIRQVIARLADAEIDIKDNILTYLGVNNDNASIWLKQCEKNLNAPLCHSAGRLFDTVSALLGISPEVVTYEGQAAIRLETVAREAHSSNKYEIPYGTLEKGDLYFIDWCTAIQYIHEIITGTEYNKNDLAMAFHIAVANSAISMVKYALSKCETDNIVLSGGVFMNKILNNIIADKLENLGLSVFIHRKIPPNDGGIALGQAVLARQG